jgi:hypothetical protein
MAWSPGAEILLRSAGHRTQFFRQSARSAAQCDPTPRLSPWSKPVDHLKNAPEQIARHRDLHHLESHLASVGDKLRADLDELFRQACQRPNVDLIRERQRA